eukprot:1772963-Rhodomonas_salina.1
MVGRWGRRPWASAAATQAACSTIHPEIKHKKPHSWYKLYGDCVFVCLISQWTLAQYTAQRVVPCASSVPHIG